MFIVEKEPSSVFSEAYRTLRTNIQYCSIDKEIKSILITSSEPEEGKSTVAGNIALSFAQDNKKVIIIDGDLRKPSIHRYFNVTNLVGLSEVLVKKNTLEDSVKHYNDNLDILTSGKIPPNPAEMISSNTMERLIKHLENIYDVIIIDSPPIRLVTDAQLLASKVDGTIYVVRADKTRIQSVRKGKRLLDKVNANILGPILFTLDQPTKTYHRYYGNDTNKKKRRLKKKDIKNKELIVN